MLKEDTRKQATIVTLKSLEYEIKLTHVLYNLNQFCPEFFYIYIWTSILLIDCITS